MSIERWFLAALLSAALCATAGEPLMKPIAGPGLGEAVDGLRATISMIKSEFGPGESIMLTWKLFNETDKPISIKLGKNHVYDFTFQTRRDGREINTARVDFTDYFSPAVTIEAGQTVTRSIDLRAIHTVNDKWCEPFGKYEVALTYMPRKITSGWVKFSITTPGELPPEADAKTAETVRSLIALLGHEDFAKREQAHKDLLSIGAPALRQLEESVATGGDPEVAQRCRALIEAIRQRNGQRPVPPPLRPKPPPPRPAPPPPPPDDEF